MEEMVVLSKPPLTRIDHETGQAVFEQMPRSFVLRDGVRRSRGGKPVPSQAQVYRDGESFQGDPGKLKRYLDKGVLDYANARVGGKRKLVGVVKPGVGYVPVENGVMDDELVGEEQA